MQLRAAFEFAAGSGALLTFGVKPSQPATGLGYLELGERIAGPRGQGEFRRVRRFVEKPGLAKARRYVASGRFAWNAGIFVWRAEAFLAEADRHAPALAEFVRELPAAAQARHTRAPVSRRCRRSRSTTPSWRRPARSPPWSPEFDWDDVGTWTALQGHLAADSAGNAVRGPVVAVDSTRNIAVSNGRAIALCAVNDLIVVETPDAVLVCHRDAAQDLKKLQGLLRKDVL